MLPSKTFNARNGFHYIGSLPKHSNISRYCQYCWVLRNTACYNTQRTRSRTLKQPATIQRGLRGKWLVTQWNTPLSTRPSKTGQTLSPSHTWLIFSSQPAGENPAGKLSQYPLPSTRPCKVQALTFSKLSYPPATLAGFWKTAYYITEMIKRWVPSHLAGHPTL